MQIFFTGYSHGDLGDDLDRIFMAMDKSLNRQLGDKSYGPGLLSWFLQFIMVPDGDPAADDPERILLKKKLKAFDLRLHLDHEAFRRADPPARVALVYAGVRRALDLMTAEEITNFDTPALIADVEALARAEGWAV